MKLMCSQWSRGDRWQNYSSSHSTTALPRFYSPLIKRKKKMGDLVTVETPAGINDGFLMQDPFLEMENFTIKSNFIACAATVELCHSHKLVRFWGHRWVHSTHWHTLSLGYSGKHAAWSHSCTNHRCMPAKESKSAMYSVKGDKRMTLFVHEIIIWKWSRVLVSLWAIIQADSSRSAAKQG